MNVASENFKGIEYVRISALPDEQKKIIWETIDQKKIIKILQGTTLLNDCVLHTDYQWWYAHQYQNEKIIKESTLQIAKLQPTYELAYATN